MGSGMIRLGNRIFNYLKYGFEKRDNKLYE